VCSRSDFNGSSALRMVETQTVIND
jgi:hypothetical protein